MAEAETVGIDGDEEKAEDILELAVLFPYGPGGKLSLLEHPDFKEKSNQLERRLADISWKNAQREEIEKKRAKEEDVVNSLKSYALALKNKDPNANKILDDLIFRQPDKAPKIQNVQSALDGDTRERYAQLQRQIIDGDFSSEGDAAIAALDWFQDPRTPKTDANINLFNDLIRYADKVESGQFTEINKALTELKGQIAAEFRKDGNSNIFGQLNGTASKDLNDLYNRASDELRLWRLGLDKDPTPTEEFEKIKEIRDKYLKEARNKTNPLGDQQDNQQEEPQLPGVPDVSPLGDRSSNPIIDAANQIANALTGTAPAAAGTLEEAQEQGELMIEEPQIKTTGDGVERMNNNFPTVYNLAKEVGIKFPEIVAAQFSLESDHGKKASGENNYLGIKATQKEIADGKATLVQTREVIDGKEVVIKDYFKDFDTLKDMLLHYKEQWNDNYKDRKGTSTSSSVEEAVKLLKSNGYATDPDYVKKILNIIKSAKAEPALF
jgi:flagellum-specific peptidoglycan hydrolase FlgJ